MSENPQMKLVVVTGLSGSGKTVALNTLEDSGYRCIDNLPISLFESLLEQLARRSPGETKVALGIDARDPDLEEFGPTVFAGLLDSKELDTTILFLECDDEVLVRRYKETRRKHPQALGGDLQGGISRERKMLSWLKEMSTLVIDTSYLNRYEFREVVLNTTVGTGTSGRTGASVRFSSFGFKYGIEKNADLVFDVRFLPNPYWDEELRPRTGLDSEISDYVLDNEVGRKFLKKFKELFDFLLPYYMKEGKHYIFVAIGCTGGRHRSVAIAEYLTAHYKDQFNVVPVFHRDIDKHT